MMASFARLKYPHLIHASIASSAPVQAVANMQGYMDVMSESFKVHFVGGSDACHNSIDTAFNTVGTLLNQGAAGRSSLAKTFGLCRPGTDPLLAVKDQTAFIEDISLLFPAQGNDPLCEGPGCNIRKMCSAYMANETLVKDPLLRLATYARTMMGAGDSCITINYEEEQIAPLLNTTLAGGGARIWTYQTCTEYGFYQVPPFL
jgi:serine protease 16